MPDPTNSAPASSDPLIVLQVEAPIRNQRVSTRQPLTVTGWVLIPKGLRQLIVTCGPQQKRAKHGIYRPDLARAFPDHAKMFDVGFQCILEPPVECVGETVLTLTAYGHDGRQHELCVPVFFDDTADQAPVSEMIKPQPSEYDEPMRLNIDKLIVDHCGLLHVGGWVVAYERVETVEILVDDELIGRAEYGRERKDVAAVWPLYPRSSTSGFLMIRDAQSLPDDFAITINARTFDGIERQSTHQVRQIKNLLLRLPPEMHRLECDTANLSTEGDLTLSGWALSSVGVDKIRVFLEGTLLGEAIYGQERPDVGNQFPTLPRSHRTGFTFTTKLNYRRIQTEHVFELETVLQDTTMRRFQVAVVVRNGSAPIAPDALDPMFMLDEPSLIEGRIAEPLQGGLGLIGWAVSRSEIDVIIIELDGHQVGTAYHGIRREDVARVYPEWPNSLLSGFAFSLPRRALTGGTHDVTVRFVNRKGTERNLSFAFEIGAGEAAEGPWTLRRTMPAAERLLIENILAHPNVAPHFLIRLKCNEAEVNSLRETLCSLAQQIYQNWYVVLSGADSRSALTMMIEREFPTIHAQIHFKDLKPSRSASNCWIVPADAGDIFSIDALSELAIAIQTNVGCDFIYADERRLNPTTHLNEAFFKPDWSPHLLTSMNYIGRPWAVPRASFERAGYKLGDFDTAGDFDVILKCSEVAQRIVHVPQILYGRENDGFDRKRDLKALKRMAERRGLEVFVEPGRIDDSYRLRSRTKTEDLVSIIIPTCGARGLIENCLESLRRLSTYTNIEIIVIDNIMDLKSPWKIWLQSHVDITIEILEPFNWSRFNNLAVKEASGSYLLFLNDDIEIIQPDWLEAMLDDAVNAEVGVVGAQLLYPDKKVQHAGLFLTRMGKARHAFRFCEAEDPGYFGLNLLRRDVIGVTGACMLMRREVYDAVGGFDEAHAVINNDLDLCLKVHAKGYSNIYTPFSQLIHHELASRATMEDEHDEAAFNDQWASLFHAGDPFFHRHLSRAHENFQYDAEPGRFVFSGHPYYLKQNVTCILALKVDHIGDFLTALPAFRRIKAHFPQCRLSVLAAPAAMQLADLEPAIDEIIPFEFFHTRSGLGQKEIDEVALEALRAKLAPKKFDLAIDLRKHPDTRKLLQYTGAKVLAGFEGNHAFPWLDIARVFEGDERFVAKRMHITDDIVCLVDQVAMAGETERSSVRKDSTFDKRRRVVAARFTNEAFYTRPLICIHPASGTPLRQWPPAFFAAVADKLVEADNVNVVVIGSPDERDLAEEMISYVKRKDRVTSIVGRLKLSELPYFISSCSLFVGNNSGPQHIAASVGVPTVGIHSGVVDPNEWGPLGEFAVAVKREMTCAPCYLAKLEDCHRALACLTQLTPDLVVSACRRMLALGRT